MISFSFFFPPSASHFFFPSSLPLLQKHHMADRIGIWCPLIRGMSRKESTRFQVTFSFLFIFFFFPFNSLFRHEGTGLSRPDRTGLGAGLGWGPASNGQAHPWVSLLL